MVLIAMGSIGKALIKMVIIGKDIIVKDLISSVTIEKVLT